MNLDDLANQINDNHLEVCERLARIEERTANLPDRVDALESYKDKAAGMVLVLSTVLTLAFNWLIKRFAQHG